MVAQRSLVGGAPIEPEVRPPAGGVSRSRRRRRAGMAMAALAVVGLVGWGSPGRLAEARAERRRRASACLGHAIRLLAGRHDPVAGRVHDHRQ